ncbi:hypothetical protein [Rheinheimera nanhaiensis]|uniref:hypothetical protein n=1 Tax=Rheinheimera nanhaiensis TaxID=1163621 RepID=UPI00068C9FBB|nr:hypothetical protein [Rheinheimera nanhaiensis]
MMRIHLVLVLLISALSVPVQASTGCIQDPKRQNACPHLLYRAVQLPGATSNSVLCVCVTDFAPLLTPAKNEAEQISQNMTKRQLEAQHGDKLQTVLDMLQQRR